MSAAPMSVQELANLFTARSLSAPLTTLQLEGDFEQFATEMEAEMAGLQGDRKKILLRSFVKKAQRDFFKDFDVAVIGEVVQALVKKVQARPEIDYTKFTLSDTDVTMDEVQTAISDIYNHISATQGEKDQCAHALSVIQLGRSFIKSLRTALDAFIMDETNCPFSFQHLSERKRFSETSLADLDVYDQRLVSFRDLTTSLLENTIGPRLNLLMRSDSAVRLIVKFDEQENGINKGQTRGNTVPQGRQRDIGQDDGTFAIQNV